MPDVRQAGDAYGLLIADASVVIFYSARGRSSCTWLSRVEPPVVVAAGGAAAGGAGAAARHHLGHG
jgi:hypothetical protein